MRHKTTSIALAVLAGVLLTAAALRSQMPAVGPQWEYTTVSVDSGYAAICYGMSYGCKTEKCNGERNDALMIAAAKLGDKGWELVSATESSDRNPVRTLYFKRLKSVLNKSEERR